MAKTYTATVAAGIKFLNRQAPGWRTVLQESLAEPTREFHAACNGINIACPVCCVLGRLFPGFWRTYTQQEQNSEVYYAVYAAGMPLGFASAKARLRPMPDFRRMSVGAAFDALRRLRGIRPTPRKAALPCAGRACHRTAYGTERYCLKCRGWFMGY